MTCTNQQVKILMKNINLCNKQTAAAKAGMDAKTARKYCKVGLLPSELKKPHDWQTRKDAFEDVWAEIEEFLTTTPNIQAKTVFGYLEPVPFPPFLERSQFHVRGIFNAT